MKIKMPEKNHSNGIDNPNAFPRLRKVQIVKIKKPKKNEEEKKYKIN